MKIQIREHNVIVSKALRSHVERRLGLALGRFGERIARVIVRFSRASDDLSPSMHGCQIDIGLRPLNVRVSDTDADLFAVVNHAVARATRSVARTLDLERERADRGSGLK